MQDISLLMGKKTLSSELSVIIPLRNGADVLDDCLAQLTDVVQIIVSDGGSTDDGVARAHLSGAEVVTGAPGRGGQLRRGAEHARGGWLLFLHVDSQLPKGWQAQIAAHINTHDTPAAFRLRFDAAGWQAHLVAGWANLRSRVFQLPYGDQGFLISRKAYDQAGGFDDIPLMEDVALVRRLSKITLLSGAITTGAVRYRKQGWFRRGAGNIWLLMRYFCGARPEDLARAYNRK